MSLSAFTRLWRTILIASILAGPIAAAPVSAGNKSKAHFVDILYLQEGKTLADAKAYFDRIEPVVAKHGLRRVQPAFVITKVMKGSVNPDLVNIWSVSDPENTFKNIFNDPKYLEHIKRRDETFDMARAHMFMMQTTN